MYNPLDIFKAEFTEARMSAKEKWGCYLHSSDKCHGVCSNLRRQVFAVNSSLWIQIDFEVFPPMFFILQVEIHCPASLGGLFLSQSGFANIKLIAFLQLE